MESFIRVLRTAIVTWTIGIICLILITALAGCQSFGQHYKTAVSVQWAAPQTEIGNFTSSLTVCEK